MLLRWISLLIVLSVQQVVTLQKKINLVDGGNVYDLTDRIREQSVSATHTLARHYGWNNIAIVMENDLTYTRYGDIMLSRLHQDAVAYRFTAPKVVSYDYSVDFVILKEILKEASNKSRVFVLMMSMRLAKEFLIAAYDMGLNDGNHVFVAYESGIVSISAFQQRPFKWVLAAYGETWNEYITRSSKLCWMWTQTLLIMPRLPKVLVAKMNNMTRKIYKVSDRSAPVETWRRFENTVYRKIGGYRMFFNPRNELRYPITVHRYGNENKGSEICAQCTLNELTGGKASCLGNHSYPTMQPIVSFELNKSTKDRYRNLKLSMRSANKIELYWPAVLKAHDFGLNNGVHDTDTSSKTNNSLYIESVTAIGILILMLIGLIIVYREYRALRKPNIQEVANKKDTIILVQASESKSNSIQNV